MTFVHHARQQMAAAAAENGLLRSHLPTRLGLSDPERSTLAEIGKRLGHKDLQLVASVGLPDTIMAWYLSKLGGAPLRRTLTEYTEHYNRERNHQGKGNVLFCALPTDDMKAQDRRLQKVKLARSRFARFFAEDSGRSPPLPIAT